jgi:hypothetical protein
MRQNKVILSLLLVTALTISGCKKSTPAPPNSSQSNTEQALSPVTTTTTALAQPRPSGPIEFTDVTAQSGIRFKHNSGASGKKYLPETLGAGCAFLDYDNDGWQDILLVNSMDWPEHKTGKSFPTLYHNNHDGMFTDVTREAGLAVEMYGLGVAAADYDNDGNIDIYLTCVGANHLFRNTGNGKFVDVTRKAGVGDTGFSTSAAWFDYDNDGRLDLFVANYVEWSIETDSSARSMERTSLTARLNHTRDRVQRSITTRATAHLKM